MRPRHDGPDISHHQGAIDWQAVPQYRLFSTKGTEGKTFKSPTFDENWRQMRRFEFRGVYHWIRSDSSMIDQVQNLKRALDAYGGLTPGSFVQLDWETTPGIRPVTVAEVEQWLAIAEGYWPGRVIVYASDWVPGFLEWRSLPQWSAYPLWYANYNTTTRPTGGWAECARYGADVWQWTSSATVPGISDPTVDMNHVFKWDTLARITAQQSPPPTTGEQTDMIILDLNPGTGWWVAMQIAGDELTHLTNGHHVAVLERGGVPRVRVNETELAGILSSVSTTNPSPFAPGMPAFNENLHNLWEAAS